VVDLAAFDGVGGVRRFRPATMSPANANNFLLTIRERPTNIRNAASARRSVRDVSMRLRKLTYGRS
jgi:hypothetical protein